MTVDAGKEDIWVSAGEISMCPPSRKAEILDGRSEAEVALDKNLDSLRQEIGTGKYCDLIPYDLYLELRFHKWDNIS
jgi:hypothetical protein